MESIRSGKSKRATSPGRDRTRRTDTGKTRSVWRPGFVALWLLPVLVLIVAARAADPTPSPSPAPAAAPEATPEPSLIPPGEAPPPPSDNMLPGEPGTFNAPTLIPPGLTPLTPIPSINPNAGSSVGTIVAPTAPVTPDLKSVKYPVSKFMVEYGKGAKKGTHPGLPTPESLAQMPFALGVPAAKGDPLTAPGGGARDETFTLAGMKGTRDFRGDALQSIYTALVGALNKKGTQGVFVLVDPEQIDPTSLADNRKGKTGLTLFVYVSEVANVRAIVKPVGKWPFKAPPSTSTTDPTYQRAADRSPLKKPVGDAHGSLLEKDTLQDYLDRINRFPGRRVDVAVTASGESASVVLDYIVHVERPSFFIYDQTTNTGTEASGEWRTRLGLEVRQIAHLDDILDVAFETSFTSPTYSGTASYLFTPIFPDRLKVKVYGAYGRFNAEDVGFDQENFEGRSATAGVQLIWTPIYLFRNTRFESFRALPLDLIAGLEYRYNETDNRSFDQTGHANFLLPTFGVSTDRTTEEGSFFANAQYQINVLGEDRAELRAMGRLEPSTAFMTLRYGAGYNHYLDHWIHHDDWDKFQAETDTEKRRAYWKSVKLAHELALQVRGQYTFADKRLIPQIEDVIGGFTTVRGYPEAYVAGDNSVVVNAEYRYHISRGLLKPLDTDAKDDPAKPRPAPRFTFRPPTILARPDLDVTLRLFYDLGYAQNNPVDGRPNLEAGRQTLETNRFLSSVGVGIEAQISRYVNLRLDCGFPLIGVRDSRTSRPVDVGDERLSFVATFTY